MANPWASEVGMTLDGKRRTLKLTLGALAELEESLGCSSFASLIERFDAGKYTTKDVLSIVVAGLRGGGWDGHASDLLKAEIDGGPLEAARVAAQLLVRAFTLPSNARG